MGDRPGAIAALRKATGLDPNFADAHAILGLILLQSGSYEEAVTELRRGQKLGSKVAESAELVRQAERMVSLSKRLPAVLAGADKPLNAPEGLAFALMAYHSRRYDSSAKLFAEALAAEPKLADDRRKEHRYDAACSATLAGCGQGKDDAPLDEAAREERREQARAWLQAELAAWAKLVEAGPIEGRPMIQQKLQHWQRDLDLAGVRDAEALKALPEEERKAWKALWDGVANLLGKVQEHR
jgi:tetratricopeptide (TPR) repeat protein